MGFTFRLKNSNEKDLAGFINILTKNGYEVNLRTGGTAHLMADVESGEAKIRERTSFVKELTLLDNVSCLSPAEIAGYLWSADDEDFAAVFAFYNKILEKNISDYSREYISKILESGLERGDMSSVDPVAIGEHISNILSEIIFSKEIDQSAWWKEGEK